MNSKRLVPLNWRTTLACMALGVAMIVSGCDGSEPGEEENPEACGGDGVLCLVSGIAGETGGQGNGGLATEAYHYWPMDVTVGSGGIIYVVDFNNHQVRKIDTDGIITRFIGSGNLGDDSSGPADQIDLNHPVSMTIGPDGNFYLGAWHNWKIKRINAQTMDVTIESGTTQGFLGDGGPATAAKMDLPGSIVYDDKGNAYISDQGNMRVRMVDAQGIITTFAGSGVKGFADGMGPDAAFDAPKGPDATPGGKLTIDPDNTALYVADTNNNRIRKIDLATGEVTTIAGNGTAGYGGDGGQAANAMLNLPADVKVSHDNDLYIADSGNNVIRKVNLTTGVITTVVGTGQKGTSPDATPADQAMLNRPFGIDFDEANHTLYIADTFNQQVKRVELDH